MSDIETNGDSGYESNSGYQSNSGLAGDTGLESTSEVALDSEPPEPAPDAEPVFDEKPVFDEEPVFDFPDPPQTGDPDVDAAIDAVARAMGGPLEEQLAVYDAAHRTLQDRLADVEG